MADAEPDVDDTVERATSALGPPLATYRVSPGRQRAKFFAALGLILLGVIFNGLWFGLGPANFNHAILHLLVWPPLIGITLLVHLARHRGLRVLVYPTGLLRLQHGQAESFTWDDITEVRMRLDIKEQPEIERDDNGDVTSVLLTTTVPRFQLWNVWVQLTRSDGTVGNFNATLEDFPALAEHVQRNTLGPLLAKMKRLLDRGEAEFGDSRLMPDSIQTKKKTLLWKDAKHFTMIGRMLVVKNASSWRGGLTWDTSAIPNVHVLLAMLAERIPMKKV